MSTIVAALQLLLAATLLTAAGGKLVRPGELSGALRLSGVPPGRATVIARMVPALEIMLALALVVVPSRALPAVFAAAGVLVLSFTAWLFSVWRRGMPIRCGCFGGSSKKVTGSAIARNFILLSAAAVGALLSVRYGTILGGSIWLAASAGALALGVVLLAAFNQIRVQLALSLSAVQERSSPTHGRGAQAV